MGAATFVYVFDHPRYRRRMVPALRRLHATGEVEPWLERAWRARHRDAPVPRFTDDLRTAAAALMTGPDLCSAGLADGADLSRWEDLQYLFEAAASTLLDGGVYRLAALPLPRHPASLEAIARAEDDGAGRCADGHDCPRRLAAVRALAGIAAGRGHGLLWARDVYL